MAPKNVTIPDDTDGAPEEYTGPQGWRPSPGDSLTGTVLAIESVESEYGSYPMISLDTGDGNVVNVHAFHSVLLKVLTKLRPKVGSALTITYVGVVKGKKTDGNGNPRKIHVYTAKDPTIPAEEFQWAEDAPEPPSDDAF